jgi:hypothetical protein
MMDTTTLVVCKGGFRAPNPTVRTPIPGDFNYQRTNRRQRAVIAKVPGFQPLAQKGEIRNFILCGFLPLFSGFGRWPTTIPIETLRAPI